MHFFCLADLHTFNFVLKTRDDVPVTVETIDRTPEILPSSGWTFSGLLARRGGVRLKRLQQGQCPGNQNSIFIEVHDHDRGHE